MSRSRIEQFDELVGPHLKTLYRMAYSLVRNTHDAQDLVQDTCVAACEHPVDVESAAQPVRWLLRVLYNRFVDGTRRGQRAPFVPMEDATAILHFATTDPGPEDLQIQADGELALEQAFLQLDSTQRTLLALRAEGYEFEEIEAITGIGREVLRVRLHRARRALALRLMESDMKPKESRARSNK